MVVFGGGWGGGEAKYLIKIGAKNAVTLRTTSKN